MNGFTRRFAAVWVAALLGTSGLAGCAGGAGTAGSAPSLLPAPAMRGAAVARHRPTFRATIRIEVPKRRRRGARGADYVSPATRSMTIAISAARGGPVLLHKTVALTPSSAGCSSTGASTRCAVTIDLPAGSYVASLSTYASTGGTGNVLSEGQREPFSISRGAANTIALTLDGVPASYVVFPGSQAVHGSSSDGGLSIYGPAAYDAVTQAPIDVIAFDSTHNAIVGPGAPSFTVHSRTGAFKIVQPAAATPNAFSVFLASARTTLAPVGDTLAVDASFADASACTEPHAVCSTTIHIASHPQSLVLLEQPNVLLYAPGFGSTSNVAAGTNPFSAGFDANADLFVGSAAPSASVIESSAPYSSAVATMTDGVHIPLYLQVDASGNVWTSELTAQTLVEYARPFTQYGGGGSPGTTHALGYASGPFTVDASGNVLIVHPGSGVDIFAPPYTTLSALDGNAGDNGVALDAAGNLWITACNSCAAGGSDGVTEYLAPDFTTTDASYNFGTYNPIPPVVDAAGDVFTAGCSVCTYPETHVLTIMSPPYSNSVQIPFPLGYGALALAVDGAGDVFVQTGNSIDAPIEEFAPPYSAASTPVKTFAQPGDGLGILLTP